MGLSRRDFLKTSVAGATAATVGMPLSKQAEAAVKAGEAGWQLGQGSLPLLRHRLRHHGRDQG
jgi:anaerobic selenocysteine-containing dehydrogenase